MKVLIVDSITEQQVFYGDLVSQVLNQLALPSDHEVKLSTPSDYEKKLPYCDLLILGSGLEDKATAIATKSRDIKKDLHVIFFVSPSSYSGGSFQVALQAGARKVFSDNSSEMDILQEFVAIQTEMFRAGQMNETQFIVVKSTKGGNGATSLAAALGEVSSHFKQRTLLWDFDVETRDLSRALSVNMQYGSILNRWLNNPDEIERTDLQDAAPPLSVYAQLLVPPSGLQESQELMCGDKGLELVQKVVRLSRSLFDVVIIDAGPFTGPAIRHLLKISNHTILVMGDNPYKVSAADEYLTYAGSLVSTPNKIRFLCSSKKYDANFLRYQLDPEDYYGANAWSLPPLLYDKRGEDWPGKTRTLYSLGSKETQITLEKIARSVKAIPAVGSSQQEELSQRYNLKTGKGGFLAKGLRTFFSPFLGSKAPHHSEEPDDSHEINSLLRPPNPFGANLEILPFSAPDKEKKPPKGMHLSKQTFASGVERKAG